MDENASELFVRSIREIYARETLSKYETDGIYSMSRSVHNGFEMWWLAGMPIVLVFLLTLLSLSVVSAGLEKTITIRIPSFLWKITSQLSTNINITTRRSSISSCSHTKHNIKVCSIRSRSINLK